MTSRTLRFLGCVATLALSASGSHAQTPQARPLTVVELFTSQGCSSCPPANANLETLSHRPDVLALSFGVTYWDDLGWKDTFAKPQYTERQWSYARALHHSQVWTPQVVINGRTDVVGTRLAEVDRAAEKAPLSPGPVIQIADGLVSVGATRGTLKSVDVWLVRYDPRVVQVPVKRGENTGKTLPHRNVVRELTRLGPFTGAAQSYRLPPDTTPGLAIAVLIQAGPGGPILAAAKS